MARGVVAKLCLVLFSVFSIIAIYIYAFSGKRQDEFSPEEINDMFQNKQSDVSVRRVELGSLGISSPYLDRHTLQSPNWDLSGDIFVQNGEGIALTSSIKQQASVMFSKTLTSAVSFEMELTFHVHSAATLAADGFAIWFVEEPLPLGDIFGAQNNFKGLGITVDTFMNGKQGSFPLVSAHYGNGYTFFDKHNDGASSMKASCTSKLLMNPVSGKSRMRIVHIKDGYLSVDLNYDPDHTGEWHNCFVVDDAILPPQFYIGLSAETGFLHQSVDIIENKIFALYTPDGNHLIESLNELETIMEQQWSSGQQNKPEIEAKPVQGKDSGTQKITRRSVSRLRRAEQRIKERDRAHRLAKYGDADATFVRRWWRRIVTGFKYSLFTVAGVFLLWVVRIALKSRKKNRRHRSSGLLD